MNAEEIAKLETRDPGLVEAVQLSGEFTDRLESRSARQPLDHVVTLGFFLQPIVSGASHASTPVTGTVASTALSTQMDDSSVLSEVIA